MKRVIPTPLTDMRTRGLTMRATQVAPQVAARLGFPDEDIVREIMTFVMYSSEIAWEPDELHIALLAPGDSPEQIAAKFIAYLNSTDDRDILTAAWTLLYRPPASDPVTGPAPLPEGAEKN